MDGASKHVCGVVYFFTMTISGIIGQVYIQNLSTDHISNIGDYNIGILVPVHEFSQTTFCGSMVRNLGVLQRVEAINFAIKEINENNEILTSASLGYILFDDCQKDITALGQSLHFARTKPADACHTLEIFDPQENDFGECYNYTATRYDVIGLIGSEDSPNTVQVANLYTSFQMPHLSYLSTAPVLSNKKKYPYFNRLVSTDRLQARAIAQFLDHHKWTYVSVIFSEGDYGEGAYKMLEEESEPYGICFAEVHQIREDFSHGEYQEMIFQLLLEKNSSITVAFVTYEEGRKLLAYSKRLKVDGRFTWIAGDGWAGSVQDIADYEDAALGMFSVSIKSERVPRFDDYMATELKPEFKTGNPWLPQFWKQYMNCTPPYDPLPGYRNCSDGIRFTQHYRYANETTVSFVFDAVYTYAHALHNLLESTCKNVTFENICVERHLPHSIRDVSFQGESRHVSFNSYGDIVEAEYLIRNLQNTSKGLQFVNIATWQSGKLNYTGQDIEWKLGFQPSSNCSETCGVGQRQVYRQKRCCYACEYCEQHQRVVMGTGWWAGQLRCQDCEANQWPDPETRRTCVEIIPEFLKWEDPLGVILCALAVFGILLCFLVTLTYILNNNHPLIKASSRELSFCMLFGMVLSYSFVFIFLTPPNRIVCFTRLLGFSLCFTLMYAPLMTKIIRIFRIFKAGKEMNRKPSCVSSKSQIGITLNITLFHVFLIVGWNIAHWPDVVKIQSPVAPNKVELICDYPMGPFISSLVFNSLLLLACMFCAFKTRKLPDNYNESKWVVFCVYSTLVIMLTCVTAYFCVNTAYFRVMFLALSVITTATIILVSLFIPKIYAIYFVNNANLNVKQGTMTKRLCGNEESEYEIEITTVFPVSNTPEETRTQVKRSLSESSKVAPMSDIKHPVSRSPSGWL